MEQPQPPVAQHVAAAPPNEPNRNIRQGEGGRRGRRRGQGGRPGGRVPPRAQQQMQLVANQVQEEAAQQAAARDVRLQQERAAAEQRRIELVERRTHCVVEMDPELAAKHMRGPLEVEQLRDELQHVLTRQRHYGWYCSLFEFRVVLILNFTTALLGSMIYFALFGSISWLAIFCQLCCVLLFGRTVQTHGMMANWFRHALHIGDPFDQQDPTRVVSGTFIQNWHYNDTWWSKWIFPHRRGYCFGHFYRPYERDVRDRSSQCIITDHNPKLVDCTVFGFFTFRSYVISIVLLEAVMNRFILSKAKSYADVETYARNCIKFFNVHTSVHEFVLQNTVDLCCWLLKI